MILMQASVRLIDLSRQMCAVTGAVLIYADIALLRTLSLCGLPCHTG